MPLISAQISTQQTVRKLLTAFIPLKNQQTKNKNEFNISSCNRMKKKEILNFLIQNKPIKKKFIFKKKCDAEGLFILQNPSPILNFKLKNLANYTKTKFKYSVSQKIDFEQNGIILTLFLKNADIRSPKKTIEFEGNYSVLINFSGKINKDIGGEIRIKSINGKKTKSGFCFKSKTIIKCQTQTL